MAKVIIIDNFSQAPGENGNNRFIYLANTLELDGFQVEIITSDFSHIKKTTRHIEKDALNELPYKYTMLHEPPYEHNASLQRFVSHFILGRNIKKYLASLKYQPDLVYIAIPSLSAANAGICYSKTKGIPSIVDIQDIWPDSFASLFRNKTLANILLLPLKKYADRIYKNATRLIGVSMTYLERGCKAKKLIPEEQSVVYLGTDISTFDSYSETNKISKPENDVWVVYVGTLGESYDIDIVTKALALLKKKGYQNLKFIVLGDGPKMSGFRKTAEELEVDALFLGRQPYSELVRYLTVSDIAVNPIAKGADQSIINKHADYAAAGLPVINTEECVEYRNLVDKYNFGINCSPDDALDVAEAIEKLVCDVDMRKTMGRNSRAFAEQKFDRKKTYKIIETFIMNTIIEGKNG